MHADNPGSRARAARVSLLLLVLTLTLTLVPGYAHAQSPGRPIAPPNDPRTVDATSLQPPLNLNGAWLAHEGDDPRYAAPSFDDRSWPVIATARPIASYFPHVDRLWYRDHVRVGPNAHGLALLEQGTKGSMEVYVNGVRLSSLGTMDHSGQNLYDEFGRVVPIPDALAASGDLTVAVRASIGRRTASSTFAGMLPTSRLLLGPFTTLTDQHTLYGFRDLLSNSINLAFALLLLLVAFALAFALRSRREYVALVVHIAALVCLMTNQVVGDVSPHDYTLWHQLLTRIFTVIHVLAGFEFYRIVLGIRRSRLIAFWEIAFALQALLSTLAAGRVLEQGHMNTYAHLQVLATVTGALFLLPLHVGVPLMALSAWWKRRNIDALLLLIPVLTNSFFDYLDDALYLLWVGGHGSTSGLGDAPIPYFNVGWSEVGILIYNLFLLLFIVVRALRLARTRATLDAEIHAAQSVQQLLLTRSQQDTPGFTVETAYRPASEVGGDFFIASPHPGLSPASRSLVAVIGDVSGKGLPAAMRVAMILGVLRREPSRDPAVVLAALNEALLDQNEIGFTTACCVSLEADGRFAIANAGHINPYRNHREIDTAPALPLGLARDETYPLTHGHLEPGESLLFVSDGIVEARSRRGELFGFERLSSIASQTAEQIADAAQSFGQEDDITVVRLACSAT